MNDGEASLTVQVAEIGEGENLFSNHKVENICKNNK